MGSRQKLVDHREALRVSTKEKRKPQRKRFSAHHLIRCKLTRRA
jgi:hypothetical protein